MPGANQNGSITPPPPLDMGEEIQRKAHGLRQGQGEITHQLLSQTKQIEPGEKRKSLIYHQSNQSRIVRNKNRSPNTFSPPLPSSRDQLHSHFSTSSPRAAQGDEEWELWSVHHTLSLPLLPCDEEGQGSPGIEAGKRCQKQQEGLLQLHQQQKEG